MNKGGLSRHIWRNATALVEEEVSDKIIVNVVGAGQAFLDKLDFAELAGVLRDVPDLYEGGARSDWIEHENTYRARKQLGALGVSIDVWDRQNVRYIIQPDERATSHG